jgi:hypothetical protein
MIASDDFSAYYAELLEGTYDCTDRIVLNAFFPLGQTGGGLRAWWRYLRGDDSTLDDDHLREMAGTFSRRLQAFCAKQGIPVIEAQARDRKNWRSPTCPPIRNFAGCSLSSRATLRPRSGKSSAMARAGSPKSVIAKAGPMSGISSFI